MIPHGTNTNYDKIPLVLWCFVLYVVYFIKQYKYLTYIITAHFKLKENIVIISSKVDWYWLVLMLIFRGQACIELDFTMLSTKW